MIKKIQHYIMYTDPWAKIFWKIWFWYGIRKAMKRMKDDKT